ncbi:MAG: polysaccharide biosynthesis tyrosine autokinase [Anaerolineae bacterium]
MNAKSSSPMSIVFKLLLRWWWLLAIAIALGGGVGYFVRTQQPDIYYARASVLFGQFFNAKEQQTLATVNQQISTFANLVRQAQIIQPVIEKMNLNISVEKFNERLLVREVPNLPLLEIIFADEDATTAANIANAVAQEMIDQSPTNRITQEAEFQLQQLREVQAQITQLEAEYNTALTEGATLTSAFEIAQNQKKAQETLKTLQELRTLYADMRVGITDSSNVISMFSYATAQNAVVVTGSLTSVVLAAVGGLVLAILTVVLIEYLDDRLEWNEHMEEVEGVRVLGPLGLIARSKLPLYSINMPSAIETEVLKQLRAKLVLESGGVEPKVVTITSYDSGDGKSVTSANMALMAAGAGLKTLLIDGDIRKGDLHEFFQLPNVMGISDILAGREELHVLLSRALLDSHHDNLTVLTSGRATSDPAALLSKPRMTELMDILKQQFDTIIIDSVPTIGGPDAAFLAERSNGVVIVVHGQRTTHNGLRRTLQALRQGANSNVKIFGVVFNRIALQATSTYNQPYYRRNLAISPERLSKEMATGSKRGLLSRNQNVIFDASGLRIFSLAAASIQLGVSVDTLKEWIKKGYVKTERHGRRQWISESEITQMLDRLPRYQIQPSGVTPARPVEDDQLRKKAGTGKLSSGKLRDLLGGQQREALLAAARENQPEETGSEEE